MSSAQCFWLTWLLQIGSCRAPCRLHLEFWLRKSIFAPQIIFTLATWPQSIRWSKLIQVCGPLWALKSLRQTLLLAKKKWLKSCFISDFLDRLVKMLHFSLMALLLLRTWSNPWSPEITQKNVWKPMIFNQDCAGEDFKCKRKSKYWFFKKKS